MHTSTPKPLCCCFDAYHAHTMHTGSSCYKPPAAPNHVPNGNILQVQL
jgi:hypothetical protein